MTQDKTPPLPNPATREANPATREANPATREERLAARLRDNLKLRKAQSRAMSELTVLAPGNAGSDSQS